MGVVVKRPARQGEGALSDAIWSTLEALGARVFRNSQAVMRRGARVYRGGLGNGSADLVVLDRGRFLALEVKRPGEIPTEEDIRRIKSKGDFERSKDDARTLGQWAWLADVRSHGGFAAYVDSVESAVAALDRARRGDRS